MSLIVQHTALSAGALCGAGRKGSFQPAVLL